MACLGVFNNILIILAVCRFPALQNTQNMLLLNMSVMSLILDTVTVPLIVFNVIGRQYLTLPGNFCQYLSYLQQSTLFNSSFAVCAVSVNRGVAVVFPHFYRRMRSRRALLVFILPCWLIPPTVCLLGVTKVLGIHEALPPFFYCSTRSVPLIFITQVVFLYIPTAITAACYVFIIAKLIFYRSGRVDPTGRAAGPTTLLVKKRARASLRIFMCFVVFLCVYYPTAIMSAVAPDSAKEQPVLFLWLRSTLAMSISLFNPVS
ncbi:hypothetical protein BV898_03095 [Hypsibius exemplaris]|uniref:G-protein coupled receptors family 1 profile domain-containing protein n=1 Tax=Hypsibius exemplaris TaxID=2072580 RepID=A0A1W0X614_HYPEX|nr:hypothetical protein BV898_03095 [Hypsibius exemplaris]